MFCKSQSKLLQLIVRHLGKINVFDQGAERTLAGNLKCVTHRFSLNPQLAELDIHALTKHSRGSNQVPAPITFVGAGARILALRK